MKIKLDLFDILIVNVYPDGLESIVKNVRSSSPLTEHFLLSLIFIEYFRCQSSGYFLDSQMNNQGKYFFCYLNPSNGIESCSFFKRSFEKFFFHFIQNIVFINVRVQKDFDFISKENCVFLRSKENLLSFAFSFVE